jgi:hypothetical protein
MLDSSRLLVHLRLEWIYQDRDRTTMSTMMMARTAMPMPMALAGDALADCPKRS